MIIQINKVCSVKIIDRIAAELSETVDRIFDLAIDMETEDGVIWVRSGLGHWYNSERPHSALDCQTPATYARTLTTALARPAMHDESSERPAIAKLAPIGANTHRTPVATKSISDLLTFDQCS